MKLNELDLNKLHVFRVLAESASMREAGERLLRTPSAISQSIAALEAGLGLRLFERTGIRLELTDAGRRILENVTGNERGLQRILDELRDEPVAITDRVTLGLPLGYPAISLSEPLSAALAGDPALQLRLRFLSHAELADGLAKDQLEMALSLQPLSRRSRRLRSARLREENLILAVPPRYRYLCAASLGEFPAVDYYQKPLQIEGWLKHHRQKTARPRIRVFGANLDHVLQLVIKGVGCAVVPRHVVAAELAAGTLLDHPLDRRHPWVVSVWLNSLRSRDRLSKGARGLWDGLLR